MTSIFSDGALHPGRDANDSAWQVLRRPEDWAGAVMTGAVIDPGAPAIALAPAPVADLEPLAGEVVAPDGTRYRSQPARDRVEVRRACDAGWTPLVGGRGTDTGRLRRPLGLALDPRRGLLAIADALNHRVQIVRAGGGEPVVTLGCTDAWGRGVPPGAPGAAGRALAEPVAVAFGSGGLLAVADRAGGRVHLYDDRFRWLGSFEPRPPGAPAGLSPAPIAVALSSGAVWVIDAAWSSPVAYRPSGEPIPGAGPPPDELAAWTSRARFAARGEIVHGPVDGLAEGLAWHRVMIDARIPDGATVAVQTFASEDPAAPAVIPWAPARPVAIPVAEVDRPDGESSRLVLSDHGRWERKRGEPYTRAARPIARLLGSGPVGGSSFTMPWAEARRLRPLDQVELVAAAGATASRPVLAITGRAVTVRIRTASAAGLALYGGGSRLTLLERDGAAPPGGPRLVGELAAGESIDLTAAAGDGALHDVPAAHGVAALLRDGDVVAIDDGAAAQATFAVHAIDRADATVLLAASVTGDFSTCDTFLRVAPGRLVVDELDWPDGAPAGEPVTVHDDDAGTAVVAAIRWVEPELGAIWLEPGPPVPWGTWTRLVLPEPAATDRGRYLWLRLVLTGATARPDDPLATATPVVRAVRLVRPRPSYLAYLPAVYGRRDEDDPSGALFLERLLAVPELRLTGIEASFEEVARQLNPLAASPDWLAFLATWFGLVFDPSWPLERRRQLVVHAHELFARRGTVAGLQRYLEIYTGNRPAIVEGFQWGRATAPSILAGEGVPLGRSALGAGAAATGRAHHFSIWVFGDGGACGAEATERAARAIIDSARPAHTTYDLHVIDGPPRVGITTTVGVDTVLIGGERPPSPIGLDAHPPHLLGRMHLPAPPRARGAATLGPIPLDDDFTLT